MAYHVAVAQFEGPLDLLVQLVEANQLEVTAISAAAVTEQFMAVVEQMETPHLAEIGRYLDLAARLLVIKSWALLPKGEAEPEPEAMRLEGELELYRRNRRRANYLAAHWAASRPSYGRPRGLTPERPVDLPAVAQLQAIFGQLEASRPVWESPAPPKLTLEHMLIRVQERLGSQPLALHGLVNPDDEPSDIALLLVAVLELVKNRQAAVHQPAPFADIMVSTHA